MNGEEITKRREKFARRFHRIESPLTLIQGINTTST